MGSEDQHTISGLLRKREPLQRENAKCCERMAVIAYIEALTEASTPSAIRGLWKAARRARLGLSCSTGTSFARSYRLSWRRLDALCRPAN